MIFQKLTTINAEHVSAFTPINSLSLNGINPFKSLGTHLFLNSFLIGRHRGPYLTTSLFNTSS